MTNGGRRKLSEVARHVNIPKGIVSTGFPAVQRQCAQMGVPFDQWQVDIGMLALGKRANGLYAAGVGGVVLSIPRQTGKTYLVGWIVFALCILFPNMTVIWTAHRTRTSNETFGKMRGMAAKPPVSGHVAAVRATNGEQEVRFTNGSRILFGAREQGFGRGFDMVDVLVLDEAQILSEDAMTDMVPATNAAPNGLVLMMGTPPRPKDPGEIFAARRADALEGDPDTLFVEFSANRGAKVIDWDELATANPSYPARTSKTAILRMQKLLGSDENFSREAYGIWDEASIAKSEISSGAWRRLADDVIPDGRRVYGVKFSVDGSLVGLAAAVRPSEGPIMVSGIRVASTAEGLSWIVDFLAERRDKLAQIVIDGQGAPGLVDDLREVGIHPREKVKRVTSRQIRVPSLTDVKAAHAMFRQAVHDEDVFHDGGAVLTGQVERARKRPIGNQGGWGWAGIGETDDVTLLDAATYAFWGAKTTTRGRS